jgi:hypothetical protein
MYEWYPVSDLGSKFVCRWCFAKQATPQLVSNPAVTYAYRASGLYLAHNKVMGCVPVIVTLWRLLNSLGYLEKSVYSTSIKVYENKADRCLLGELDFSVLMPRASIDGQKLVIGEARGKNDYVEGDLETIRCVAHHFGKDFIAKHLCVCISTLKETFSDDEKRLLRSMADDSYELLPFTRLDLDPYDLHERFEKLPNRYAQTLHQLAANLMTVNIG